MPLGWIREMLWPESLSISRSFNAYQSSMPSLQNAVDALAGWETSFPPDYRLRAGPFAAFKDARIIWAIECFGSLTGGHVLELGPLDGGHTSMLDAAGAQVDAIEADRLAFMRCLVTKEIFALTRSTFWLGDFIEAVENWEDSYDLIVASGVLHHQKDPLRLIELAAKRTNALYLWTPVVMGETIPPRDPRRRMLAETVENRNFHGIDVEVYRRTYAHAEESASFASGISDEHVWLHRNDLVEALKIIGFHDVRTAHDEPDDHFGPALSIFARK